jgi:GTPase SAR1 family protein
MIGSIYAVGAAGTGKSTFSASLKEWMISQGFDVAVANLDPGAEYLPYDADFDIRDLISLSEVMSEYSLGPNGAQVVAADLMLENFQTMLKPLEEFEDYYVIFDTPGQIELFAFRQASPQLVDAISGSRATIAFISDAILASSPSGFVSQKLLYGAVISRFFKPSMNVMNKSDLISDTEMDTIKEWEEDTDKLLEAYMNEKQKAEKSYFAGIIRAFSEISVAGKVIPVSSRDLLGFEDVYSSMSMSFTGGEDTDTSMKDD